MKKFIVALIVALICNITAAHAEEVDPYFAWDIKNFDAYRQHDLIFGAFNYNGVAELRNRIYSYINDGQYFLAATHGELLETMQKVAFGADYFDAGLTELVAKLYIAADELDAAERKIDLLTANAADDFSRIRALNLRADLLNRREKFSDALQAALAADELLKTAPDEQLRLMTASRMARAYCGLDKTQESETVIEKNFPSFKIETLAEDSAENLAILSTVIDLCIKKQNYKAGESLLADKASKIVDRYTQSKKNISAPAEVALEVADFCFKTGDATNGEKFLGTALDLTDEFILKTDASLAARSLYRKINALADKHLDENHPTRLKSNFAVVHLDFTNGLGTVPQTMNFYEKNLPKFKKIFGEEHDDTRALVRFLANNNIAIGNYAAAQKLIEENLHVCRKHFGDNDYRTIRTAVELANVQYRMGKYKTADKLLADLYAQNKDYLDKDPMPQAAYEFLYTRADGARMKGALADSHNDFMKLRRKNKNVRMEIAQLLGMFEFINDSSAYDMLDLNTQSSMGTTYTAEHLHLLNDIAESQAKFGDMTEAARFAEQVVKLSRNQFGKDNLFEWRALNTLSKVRRNQGNFTDALNLDTKALHITETVCGKNSVERLQSLDALASDHSAAGNFAEAIKIREQALNDYKKILEDTDAATLQMMTNLADNYVAAGRYADADKLCDETFNLQSDVARIEKFFSCYPNVAELIRIKAQSLTHSGKVNAFDAYKMLIKIYETKRAVQSLNVMSSTENKAKWFANKVSDYKDAAAVAAATDNPDFAFYCTELCKGRSLIDRFDDVIGAKNYLLTADEKNNLAEYAQLLQDTQALSDHAAAVNNETTFFYAETIYNRLSAKKMLLELDLHKKYFDNMIPKNSEQDDTKPNPNNLNWLKTFDWDDILKNFDVQKNRAAIPDDACLVEFMKTADDSLLMTFLRNEGDLQAVNVPVDKNFFAACRLYHDRNAYADLDAMNRDNKFLWHIGNNFGIAADRTSAPDDSEPVKDNATFIDLRNRLAADLSAQLMPTLEKFADSSKHWIISPDVELSLVPFETLTYRGGLLIENKNVSYVPSLAVMNLMKNRERKNAYLSRSKELFAMGDAVYGGNDSATSRQIRRNFFSSLRGGSDLKLDIKALRWEDLSGTARELDKVEPLFDSKAIFRREQVTEKNLRQLNASGELSKYKYLLFAAHGMFVPERPEYSAIVLSQLNDADFDGYITVGEWMSYDLRSNLIYLSACESGLGDYRAGEGLIGIPYALTVAGNKDTVMSLWKVDDTATAEFTAAVFEKLSRGQSEVTALNDTKREFLSKPAYNSPSIWAAFMLYGI